METKKQIHVRGQQNGQQLNHQESSKKKMDGIHRGKQGESGGSTKTTNDEPKMDSSPV